MAQQQFISIDIGVKNMAICVATPSSEYHFNISLWEVMKFEGVNTECIVKKVISWLLDKTNGFTIDDKTIKVLIERQCSRNIKAFTLQYVIYGYFLSLLPSSNVILCDAKIKPLRSSGKKRKSESVSYVLNTRDLISDDWMHFLKSQKKKDDYTDALLQIIGFNKRVNTVATKTTNGSSRKKRKVTRDEVIDLT